MRAWIIAATLLLLSPLATEAQVGQNAAGVRQGIDRGIGAFRPSTRLAPNVDAKPVQLSPVITSSGAGSSRPARLLTVPSLPASTVTPTVRRAIPVSSGVSKEQLRKVQALLQLEGYYSGNIDGLYGPKTRRAIERFQKANGQIPTGMVTYLLLSAL